MLAPRWTLQTAAPVSHALRTGATAAALAIALLCLAACGKSKAELQAEKDADEARFDAAAAADAEREHKLSQEATAQGAAQAEKEVSSPALAPGEIAYRNVTAARARVQVAQAAAPVGDRQARFEELRASVAGNLPHDSSPRFFGSALNSAGNAVCGNVDYEEWNNGVRGRSPHRAFIATVNNTIVDTGAPGVHEKFQRLASDTNCY